MTSPGDVLDKFLTNLIVSNNSNNSDSKQHKKTKTKDKKKLCSFHQKEEEKKERDDNVVGVTILVKCRNDKDTTNVHDIYETLQGIVKSKKFFRSISEKKRDKEWELGLLFPAREYKQLQKDLVNVKESQSGTKLNISIMEC